MKEASKKRRKGEVKARETQKKIVYIWPLELVHLRDTGSKTGFDMTGPDKIMSVMVAGGTEVKQSFWDALKQGIEKSVRRASEASDAQEELDLKVDLALTLPKRYGCFTFLHGEQYTGQWLQGEVQGTGTLSYYGVSFAGTFEKGQKVGTAKITFSDGSVFVGNTDGGKPNGYGEYATELGDSYVGDWKEGRRHGVGDAVWTSGDHYIGEWSNGFIDGFGIFNSATKMHYEGEWKSNLFHGKGILTTKEGVYIGNFEQGMKSGPGLMKYKDETSYEGYWKDDRWHGYGMHSTHLGTYTGDFVRGKREGKGEMIFGDDSVYAGPWRDNRPNGSAGVYMNANGYEVRYEGDWENGKRHGKGVQSFQDLSAFEGTFHLNQAHGNGRVTYSNGTVLSGRWLHGVPDARTQAVLAGDEKGISVDNNFDEITGADWLRTPSLPFLTRHALTD